MAEGDVEENQVPRRRSDRTGLAGEMQRGREKQSASSRQNHARGRTDYYQELEAIAKFSQSTSKVCLFDFSAANTDFSSMKDYSSNLLAGTRLSDRSLLSWSI